MKNLIDKLTELREKATRGEYANWEGYRLMALDESYGGGCSLVGDNMKEKDINYIAILHNIFPLIKQHFEAAEKFVEAVKNAQDGENCCIHTCKTGCFHDACGDAIAEYREAIKDL